MRRLDTTTRKRMRRKRQANILQLLFVVIIVFAFPLGLKLWMKIKIDSLSYKLTALEDERKRLMTEVMQLRVERASLISPERVKKKARAMGLRKPREGQVIILK